MDGTIQDSKEFNLNRTALQNSFNFNLENSNDFKTYKFQLNDLEVKQVHVKINKDQRVLFSNCKISIEDIEVNLSNIPIDSEIIITDASLLSIVSKKLLNNHEVSINFDGDINYNAMTSPLKVEIVISIKGFFEGGH